MNNSKKNKIPEHIFFKLGGTWDMITKNEMLEGEGVLDDDAIYDLEKKFGYFKNKSNISKSEKLLAKYIYTFIQKESKVSSELVNKLHFIPDPGAGKFISIYSGDSSHLRTSLIAPLVRFLLTYAKDNPMQPILGAQGTDTADIALLPLLDVFAFDTNLPPFILTGANKAHREHNSDAPRNFTDLFTVAKMDLRPGAYWVFAGYLFKASDLIKISPLESRTISNFATFYSPHLKAEKLEDVEKNADEKVTRKYSLPLTHPVQSMTMTSLFDAIQKVHIVDLGEQNEISQDVSEIMNPKFKAVIVAGHSFGNVSNPIKYACTQAALKGKIVIVVSRCLITDVNRKYKASLLTINNHELRSKGKHVVSSHKLNKNISKALAVRAVIEKLTQEQAQVLFDRYAASRYLSDQDMVVV